MVTAEPRSELQTVTRLRDACLIGHRVTRAYSEWRKRGRAGAMVSACAYPLLWTMYTALTSWEASNTVHAGAASMIIPNPVARRRRCLWRGTLLLYALILAIGAVQLVLPPTARYAFRALGALILLATLAEIGVSWRIGRQAAPLKTTAKQLRRELPGPLVCGSTFAAWPTRGGHGGPLLDAAVNELRRDGVSLLVQARDDELVAAYRRHGAVSASSTEPRHLLWRVGDRRPPPDSA